MTIGENDLVFRVDKDISTLPEHLRPLLRSIANRVEDMQSVLENLDNEIYNLDVQLTNHDQILDELLKEVALLQARMLAK
jgi:hypothetical protein